MKKGWAGVRLYSIEVNGVPGAGHDDGGNTLIT